MMALVTGGASSGKSAFAEQLACSLPGARYYLAAMKPYGEEGARRIARHRALRAGKGFITVECYEGLDDVAAPAKQARDSSSDRSPASMPLHPGGGGSGATDSSLPHASTGATTALLESLGNVVANELFADSGVQVPFDEALRNVLAGVDHLAGQFDNLVIVGDEVGGDGVRYEESTEAYVRLIGSAACVIAQRCDLVVECVAGQPFVVKNLES